MGEVYKATDTRLDRAVAIKVLAPALATDPQFRERFDREARAISQLTHPNICTLYDVGEHEGTAYLVMELLDGQTLQQRLTGGGLPIDVALSFAIQIGEALASAHRAGIVHRDLKPGNIMLTRSGVKLLDFGLAKATASAQASGGLTMLPTTPAAMTAQGTIVGTFQYMAPEQIDGQEADARTDLFAFGCVVYEMVTGKKAFEGKTQASLIGAIMHAEPPPLAAVSPVAPAVLDRLVHKCLAKDPDARWQSARDLVDELKWIADGGVRTPAAAVAAQSPTGRAWLPWTIAAAATLAALGFAVVGQRRPAPATVAHATRFTVRLPEGWSLAPTLAAIAVSPDGTNIVFSALNRNDVSQLWLRPLDAIEARPIPNTEGASGAFWSPDGQWIGFINRTTKQLKKTDLNGVRSQVICDQVSPLGASWSGDGIIAFGSTAGIQQVPVSGGTPTPVTKPVPGDGNHLGPTFLPDGKRFLFVIFGRGLFVGSLDGAAPRSVTRNVTDIYRLMDDQLLTVRGRALVSQHLDLRTLALTGEPASVANEDILGFSTSASVLAYQPRRDGGVHELNWFGRAGGPARPLGDRADYSNVELSPDGTRVAIAILEPRSRTRDIWIYDVARAIRQRFTFGAGDERTPLWSPDGKRLLFNARSTTVALDFFQRPADGSGREEPVLVDGVSKDALSWSADERYLLYRATGATTNNDLWVLPTFGDRKPFPFAMSLFDEQDGRIAPDGRWVVYSTDESGQMEVYAARFPGGGAKTRISTAGGSHPRWRRDGKELFYLSLDNKMVALDIDLAADGLRIGDAHALFTVHPPTQPGYVYDVTADGQRFLVNTDVGAIPPLTVVTNWTTAR